MALLFMDGFDAGDGAVKWTAFNASLASSTRFADGLCARLSSSQSNLRTGFPASSKVIVGFAVTYGGASTTIPLLSLYSGAGATVHIQLVQNGDGSLLVRRGSTNLGSTSVSLPANGWAYVEVSATLSDTVGVVTVRVNGVQAFTFTGDTRNGGTDTTFDTLLLGGMLSYGFDDVYICNDTGTTNNDFLGDVRVQTLVPTGPGSSAALTPSTGANWSCVDELPYSATDFVSGSTVGNRDTYATADLPASVASIKAVQINTIAKKTDAGARSLKTALRSGGTNYAGASTALSATDSVVSTIRETNPATGAAWTVADVNAMEIGVEVA